MKDIQKEENPVLDIRVFRKKVTLTESRRSTGFRIEAFQYDIRVRLAILEKYNPVEDKNYFLVYISVLSGDLCFNHTWSLKQVENCVSSGVFVKFALRCIFSNDVSDKIIKYYKY